MAQDMLTAPDVERACQKYERTFLFDGGGLYFRKQTATAASWTLRYRFAGERGFPLWLRHQCPLQVELAFGPGGRSLSAAGWWPHRLRVLSTSLKM